MGLLRSRQVLVHSRLGQLVHSRLVQLVHSMMVLREQHKRAQEHMSRSWIS
ncbi:MAG: hypothetical protein ABGZ23_17445 [Fuerstiella sp.]